MIVKHGADFAKRVADDEAVANFERSVLDEDVANGTASAIELGFQHGADRGAVGRGARVADIGDEADHLQQMVEVDALLGADFDEDSVAAPVFRD